MSNWKSYGLIPFVAGFVGWFTNSLAGQMIFYPIKWKGLPLFRIEGEPLGQSLWPQWPWPGHPGGSLATHGTLVSRFDLT